jgi:hypothetical protein
VLPKISAEFQSPITSEELTEHPVVQYSLIPLLRYECECLNILKMAIAHPESKESLREASLDLTDYALRCIKESTEQLKKPIQPHETSQLIHLITISKSIAYRLCLDCTIILYQLLLDEAKKKHRPLKDAFVSCLILSTDGPMLISDLILCQPWEKDKQAIIPVFNLDAPMWCKLETFSKESTDRIAILLLRLMLNLEKVQSSYFRSDARKKKFRKVIECLETKEWMNERDYNAFKVELDEHNLKSLLLDDSPNKRPQPLEVSTLPFLEEQLEKTFNEGHSKILAQNLKEILDTSSSAFEEKAKIWLGDLDDSKLFDPSLLPQVHTCSMCFAKEVTKFCSDCKEVWYCSRKCQKSHWKYHKIDCRTTNGRAHPIRKRLLLN